MGILPPRQYFATAFDDHRIPVRETIDGGISRFPSLISASIKSASWKYSINRSSSRRFLRALAQSWG